MPQAAGQNLSLMFMRIGRCVVAFALCSSIGGHWLGLQSIAWATMIADYSQHCSFGQAIVQTFDGKHPCDLCKHISKAKATEKKQDNQRGATKVVCAEGGTWKRWLISGRITATLSRTGQRSPCQPTASSGL